MKYGAFFPTRDMPADRVAIRDWAQAAEGLGFDFIEVSDHVLGVDREQVEGFEGPYDIHDSFHEVFTTLSFIAGVTDRVGLASGVLVLPQRQTALVAKQAAQLDILCGGRLRLGVGVGWNPVEYEALGEQWRTRGRRQREQIELMRLLWTQSVVNFDGEFDQVHGAGINPLPIQRPIPVWFGGGAQATLERAAELGAGWIPLGGPSQRAAEQLDALKGLLAHQGRDPADFGIEAWIRRTENDPDAWASQVERWRELGANHATFYTSGLGVGPLHAQISAMEQFARRVM